MNAVKNGMKMTRGRAAAAVASVMVLALAGFESLAGATGTPITSGFATETTYITAVVGLGIVLTVLVVGWSAGIRLFSKLIKFVIARF